MVAKVGRFLSCSIVLVGEAGLRYDTSVVGLGEFLALGLEGGEYWFGVWDVKEMGFGVYCELDGVMEYLSRV